MLDPLRIEVLVDAMEEILRRKTPAERLAIGSKDVASMAYGETRLTNDIDGVAGICEAEISDVVAAFPAPEFYLSDELIRDALRRDGQFNIVHPGSGLKVDVMVRKDTPFDRSRFARARSLGLAESYRAAFASAEDVIKKTEYFRVKEVSDVCLVPRRIAHYGGAAGWVCFDQASEVNGKIRLSWRSAPTDAERQGGRGAPGVQAPARGPHPARVVQEDAPGTGYHVGASG